MRYLLKRLAEAVASMFGVSILIFILSRSTGNPVPLLVGPEATAQQIADMEAKLGLDDPLPVQYLHFLNQLLHGDLGFSLRFNEPSSELIGGALYNTFVLAVCAIVFALVVGVSIGMLASRNPGGITDRFGRVLALAGQSVPPFLVGLLVILVFAEMWGVLPASNFNGPSSLLLPAFTLGWFSTAALLRITQSSMRESLDSHYITVARAKGLSEGRVIGRHALRNSFVAIASVGALQFVLLLNGAVVTETLFNWPGIGQLLVQAAFARDYALVQAIVIVAAVATILVNLLTDLAYAFFDPRIRNR